MQLLISLLCSLESIGTESHIRRKLESRHFQLQCKYPLRDAIQDILFQVDLSTGLAIEEACYAQVSNSTNQFNAEKTTRYSDPISYSTFINKK